MGELIADAPQQELGDPSPAAPADHDDVSVDTVGDAGDDRGRPSLLDKRLMTDSRVGQRLALVRLAFDDGAASLRAVVVRVAARRRPLVLHHPTLVLAVLAVVGGRLPVAAGSAPAEFDLGKRWSEWVELRGIEP